MQINPSDLRKKRRTNCTTTLKHVVIAGGTHGNERNGVYLAKYFLKHPEIVKRSSFETTTILSNPAAIKANSRYVDEDMNRCFLFDDLVHKLKSNIERKRAYELNDKFGPKSSLSPKTDFIFDLHNTTAATGIALMFAADDLFALQVAAHLLSLDPSVKLSTWANDSDWSMFPTVARSGMTVEVGAASWGCIAPAAFLQTKNLILAALDFIDAHNQYIARLPSLLCEDKKEEIHRKVEIFQRVHYVKYPRDDKGELTGMIHPELQGQDFKELHHGHPIFLMFDGKNILFDSNIYEPGAIYPFFINEAAYYEKDIAFMLSRKVSIDVRYHNTDYPKLAKGDHENRKVKRKKLNQTSNNK